MTKTVSNINFMKIKILILLKLLELIVLYWSVKLITNINKYNKYNYNPAAFKIQFVFAWLLFTGYLIRKYQNKVKIYQVLKITFHLLKNVRSIKFMTMYELI